jgi:hypothetical protein
MQATCDNFGLYTDPADRVPEEFLHEYSNGSRAIILVRGCGDKLKIY